MLEEIYRIITTYDQAFRSGLWVTLEMCAWTCGIGLPIGFVLAVIGYRFRTPFYYLFSAVTLLVIAIPMIVILYWLNYPLQQLMDWDIDPFLTATFAFTLVHTFLVYQLLVEAFRRFPKHFVTVARMCGLSKWTTLFRIQLPLILRDFIPSYLALAVFSLQSTILASLISVPELFRKAGQINASISKPVEIYSAMAYFFLVICLPLYFAAFVLHKKFARDLEEI